MGSGLARLLIEMRRLRNEAVHIPEFELSLDAAQHYIATAEIVASALPVVLTKAADG